MKKILLIIAILFSPIVAFADINEKFDIYYEKYLHEREILGDEEYSEILEESLMQITKDYLEIDKRVSIIKSEIGLREREKITLDTPKSLYIKETARKEIRLLKNALLKAIDNFYGIDVEKNIHLSYEKEKQASYIHYDELYRETVNYPEYEMVNKKVDTFLNIKNAVLSSGEYLQLIQELNIKIEEKIQELELLKTNNYQERIKKFKNLRILKVIRQNDTVLNEEIQRGLNELFDLLEN